jgi:hypothetical protein
MHDVDIVPRLGAKINLCMKYNNNNNNIIIMTVNLHDIVGSSQLRAGKLPRGFCNQLPDEVTIIIRLLMNNDPTKRPSAEDIKDDKLHELKKLRKKCKESWGKGKANDDSYAEKLLVIVKSCTTLIFIMML